MTDLLLGVLLGLILQDVDLLALTVLMEQIRQQVPASPKPQ